MNLTRLPDLPSITLFNQADPLAWPKAASDWMQSAKSAIEGDSTANTALLAFVANTGVQMPNGIVTAPSLAFYDDPSTGIYQPAIGSIAVAVEGVQQLLVSSSGIITIPTLDVTTINSTTENTTTINATTVNASTVNAPTGDLTFASTSGAVRAPTIAVTDKSTAVATTAFVATTPVVYDNIGRNKLHNPMLNIWQRGGGPFTANLAYTADRWQITISLDTDSVTQVTLADADRTALGDEEAQYCITNVFTGNAGAGSYSYLVQKMENLRRFAGKTLTVSFWAKAASGTPKLGINFVQNWGTGGSPSGGAWSLATGVQTAALSTTWTKYSATIAIPTSIGTTFGSNLDSSLGFGIFYSSGATANGVAGNIGVQSGTVSIWGLQVEIGSVATALEKPDIRYDFSNCQRFYQESPSWSYYGYAVGIITLATDLSLAVQMRATPSTVNYSFATAVNVTSPAIAALSNTALQMAAASAATGPFGMVAAWNATADL